MYVQPGDVLSIPSIQSYSWIGCNYYFESYPDARGR